MKDNNLDVLKPLVTSVIEKMSATDLEAIIIEALIDWKKEDSDRDPLQLLESSYTHTNLKFFAERESRSAAAFLKDHLGEAAFARVCAAVIAEKTQTEESEHSQLINQKRNGFS